MGYLHRKLGRISTRADKLHNELKEFVSMRTAGFSQENLDILEKMVSDIGHVCSEIDESEYDIEDYHHIDDCDDYETECCRKHVDDDVDDDVDSDLVVASKNALGMFYKLRGRVAPVDESMDDYQIRMVFDNLRDTVEGEPNYARLDAHKTLQMELD